MKDTRTIKRRHLIYYLEVFNEDTGEQVGHLVDITTSGVKVISKKPIETGQRTRLKMVLPEGYFKESVISFEGISRWCGSDVNPDFYVTGYEVPNLDRDARKIIIKLITWLGFND